MKKLIGIGALVCYLLVVAKFNRVPDCTSPEATCVAARFAGGTAGVMTDPFAILMMLICFALGVRKERFLFASAVSTAFSILVVIDAYSYWVEIGVISVPERWVQILLSYLLLGSIAFWAGLGLRRLASRKTPSAL
ncbi:MAG: hypothetical protein ACRED2_02690 [Methylocella sp.]